MAEINQKETADEIVRETRQTKDALAASVGYDIDRILEDARQRQKESGRKILPPPACKEA